MNRIAFSGDDSRFNDELRLLGVGDREEMPAGFVSRRQGLPAYLLVLFHDTVWVELQGVQREVEPGSLVLWDRYSPHWFGHATNSWCHSWVVFSGAAWIEDSAWMKPLFETPQLFDDIRYLEDGFVRMLREFEEMERPSLPILTGNIRLLLRELGRGRELSSNMMIRSDPVQRASRWITANLKNKITVTDVARQAAVSPSRLQQLFHLKYGSSVQVWVEQQRLQEVCYWLMHSGLNIGEIADLTGFSDGFYLSRRFSRMFGQSPTAYRKTHFGEASEDSVPSHN